MSFTWQFDMVGETTNKFLIRTKLNRPPVGTDFVYRPHLLERLEKHRQRPLTLVSAPAGYGKSTLVSSWLEASSSPGAWVSLDKNDDNLHLFLSYFLAAVQNMFPDVGRKTLTMLDALTLPSVSLLAGSLINELELIEQPFILVLDDYQHIQDESVHDLLTELLHHPSQSMHLVLISRRDPPLLISTLRAQGLVTEIRIQDLRFTMAETATFLKQLLGIQIDPSIIAALEEKTEGWVTGLRLAALSMRHLGNLDPSLLEPQVDAQYVMEYLFNEVFSQQPPEIIQYLLGTAILDRFCSPLCEAVCAPGAEPFTCEMGGWEFVAWLKKENLFLIPLDAENRWFRYHHLFRKLLVNQLNRRSSAEEIKALHAQASAWFFENDLIEESLRHTLTAGDAETAGSLVARFGHQLMNDQQWMRLERCLRLLPRDQIELDPALLVLEAWLHHVRQNLSGMSSCLKRIETLNTTSPPDTFVNVKYVQGHSEAMCAFQHYMAADGESASALSRRTLKEIPLHHKRARLFADIFQLGAYQMIGNLETGLAVYQEAMGRYTERDKNYHALYLANLGLVNWMDANLIALQQTAECLLDVINGNSLPATVSYGLYFLGIFHYHRNDLQRAEEKLAEVVKIYHAVSPMNFAHSAFALALTYQAQGKPGQAGEISKSVVVDSTETNNADMLQAARAFEVELALRQGRLAEASRWVEKYQAKPFLPTYRFYMPQLTAVKIMLAQDTTASRRQAADLLDQLHDFHTSIHNKIFQISVLALQAVQLDSGGEKSVAMEKLTEALNLAEPGGFIRLFVDLGPQMTDLLKRLIQKNVAVEYVGRILSAFREDAQRVVSDAFHHEQYPPIQRSSSSSNSAFPPGRRPLWPLRAGCRIPNSDFHTSQPLVQPLTNRELQILDLLGQWLQNKEIAAELFISPQTVKKHLGNIFGKLNVSNRRQAVEKARILGILT